MSTNEQFAIEQVGYQPPLGQSDHLVLVFDYICEAKRRSDKSKMIRKINFHKLIKVLNNTRFEVVVSGGVNNHCKIITEELQKLINENSNIVLQRSSNTFDFKIRSRTRKWIAARNTVWEVHKSAGSTDTWNCFRLLRNKVTALIREDKRNYQFTLVSKIWANPKLLYKIINRRRRIKPGVSALKIENKTTETAFETANALVDFYSTVFTVDDGLKYTCQK